MDYSLLVGVHHMDDDSGMQPTPNHASVMGTSKFRSHSGGFPAHGELYFIGIIDCLTFYGAAKKVAHSFKSLLWSKDQLSTVQAQFYAERFLLYMEDIFPPGSPAPVEPFVPCAATSADETLYTTLQVLREVYRKSPLPCPDVTDTQQLTAVSYHPIEVSSGATVSVKEYAPGVLAALRSLWNCNEQELIDDLDVPLLQVQ